MYKKGDKIRYIKYYQGSTKHKYGVEIGDTGIILNTSGFAEYPFYCMMNTGKGVVHMYFNENEIEKIDGRKTSLMNLLNT